MTIVYLIIHPDWIKYRKKKKNYKAIGKCRLFGQLEKSMSGSTVEVPDSEVVE